MSQNLLPKGFGPCWRDPYVWKDKEIWKMIIGSEKEKRGAILLYESPNLTEWAYRGCILNETRKNINKCECPQLLRFTKDDALIFSCESVVYWQTGRFKNNDFQIKYQGLLDGGVSFYAAKALSVFSKNIIWGWLEEERSTNEQKKAGWSGALSLPRELFIERGSLHARPSVNLVKLRNKHAQINIPVERKTLLKIPSKINLRACEILIAFKPNNSSWLKLHIYANDKRGGGVPVAINLSQHKLGNVEFSNVNTENNNYTLRLYIDHSIIEACINNRVWQTIRTYPTKSNNFITLEHDGCTIKK